MPAPTRVRRTAVLIALAAFVLPSQAEAVRGESPKGDKKDEARVQFIRRVSGATPFTDRCGDASGGDPIVGSEVEVHLAVNPRDPDHLLASWQQDRYSGGGGARSDLVAVSRDGGETWSDPITVPGISSCTDPGSAFTRATDPWGSIGPDGTAYLASLAFTRNPGAAPDDAEQVSVSADGGVTWDPEPAAIEVGDRFLEKPEIAADPDKPGHAYMVYEVLEEEAGGATGGFSRFARTEDAWKTTIGPTTIPPDQPGMVESAREVLPISQSGDRTTLVVISDRVHSSTRGVGTGPVTLYSVRSENLGGTWSRPVEIATYVRNVNRGDPETVRAMPAGVLSAALAPDGTLYVAWAEPTPVGTAPGGTNVRVARSSDTGRAWDTSTVASFPHVASLPTVAVAGDGTVGVLWYDVRRDVPGDEKLTMDAWFATSRDGGREWRETHLAGPFDMRQAPVDNDGFRLFLGDYAGLVGFPRGFGALFPMAPPEAVRGPSDAFFARIHLPSASGGLMKTSVP